MRLLLILLGLGLVGYYGWATSAFWQAAGRHQLQLLRLLAGWSLLAALGSIFFLFGAFGDRYGILSVIGLAFALGTPFLWGLGRVGPRLRQYGLSFGSVLFGRR